MRYLVVGVIGVLTCLSFLFSDLQAQEGTKQIAYQLEFEENNYRANGWEQRRKGNHI
jgi:hypothetical protein